MKKPITKELLKNNGFVKSGIFLLKSILALCVIFFMLRATPQAWFWAQMQFVRLDDISKLEEVIGKAIAEDNTSWVQKWLQYRPHEDAEKMIEKLPALTSELPSMAFFELAKRAKYLEKQDEYVFWYFFAQFRLRYDVIRCGSPNSVDFMNELMSVFIKDRLESIASNSVKMRGILQEVLAFDAKYPARNNPAFICKAIGHMQSGKFKAVPKESWAAVRHALRNVTEDAIREMNKSDDNDKKSQGDSDRKSQSDSDKKSPDDSDKKSPDDSNKK